ncbi:MAG TPA: ATP-binding protein [Acidobacteriota bacterium]|nr:ATP-binding protein [Acidobacteriota bacterium]
MALHSLRFRLVLWFLLIETLALILFSFLLYEILARNLYTHHDDLLLYTQKNLTDQIQPLVVTNFTDIPADFYKRKEAFEIRSSNGKTILSTTEFQKISNNIPSIPYEDGRFLTAEADNHEPVRILISLLDGKYYLLQASWLGDIKHTLYQLKLILLILVPVVLAATSFGGYLIAFRALKPVDQITAKTREIQAKNLDHFLEIKTSDTELRNLVETLNQMMRRLNDSFRNMRQFTADASHELKTPLTIVAGTLEVTLNKNRNSEEYKEAIQTALEQIRRITDIVNDLLLLSALDSGKADSSRRPLDLSGLTTEICELIQPLISDKQITLSLSKDEKTVVLGDRNEMSQVVLNLLDNAIKYTPTGGSIAVKVRKENGSGVISVQDSGPGIPKEDLPHIFERFYRVDKSRSGDSGGTGLGLAIVERIVESHSGEIQVSSKKGDGSLFIVKIPLT